MTTVANYHKCSELKQIYYFTIPVVRTPELISLVESHGIVRSVFLTRGSRKFFHAFLSFKKIPQLAARLHFKPIMAGQVPPMCINLLPPSYTFKGAVYLL